MGITPEVNGPRKVSRLERMFIGIAGGFRSLNKGVARYHEAGVRLIERQELNIRLRYLEAMSGPFDLITGSNQYQELARSNLYVDDINIGSADSMVWEPVPGLIKGVLDEVLRIDFSNDPNLDFTLAGANGSLKVADCGNGLPGVVIIFESENLGLNFIFRQSPSGSREYSVLVGNKRLDQTQMVTIHAQLDNTGNIFPGTVEINKNVVQL